MTGDAAQAHGGTDRDSEQLAATVQQRLDAARQLDIVRFGMWLFLIAEVMFFAALIGAVLVIRRGQATWPPPAVAAAMSVAAANVAVLVASSLVLEWAARTLARSQRRQLNWTLLAALVLGAVFLAIQCSEYVNTWRGGVTLTSDIAASCFYVLVWAHGLHVLGGLGFLGYVGLLAVTRKLHLTRRAPMDACRIYWHFVVLLWIALFFFLYVG